MQNTTERKVPLSEQERNFLVEQALEHRLTYGEYLRNLEGEKQFFTETELDRDAVNADTQRMLDSVQYVICHDFEDIHGFLPLLQKFCTIPEDTIPHERAHWDQFIVEGFTPIIGFYFASIDAINFRRILQIFTSHTTIPEGMTDAEYFEAMKRVIAAPEHLSQSDLVMLGRRE